MKSFEILTFFRAKQPLSFYIVVWLFLIIWIGNTEITSELNINTVPKEK